MALTMQDLKNMLAAEYAASDDGAGGLGDQLGLLFEKTYDDLKAAADGGANSTTSAVYFMRATAACRVVRAYAIPRGSLTAHDSTYATITIKKNGSTTVATLATTTTGSGNWVDGTPEAFTLSSTVSALQLAAGDVLSWEIAKASTGVVVPIVKFQVETELGEPLP